MKERCNGDVMDSHIFVSRCRGGGDDGTTARLRSPRSGEAEVALHGWKGASLSKRGASCAALALRAFVTM